MEVCYFMNFRLVHKILLVLAQCNIPNIECIDIIMEEKEEEAKGKEQDVDNKMNKDEDEEQLPDLPDKCPICDKESKNLLLHIRKKESCSSKIDPKLYEYWKREQNKSSKRKYQVTYIKKGKHNLAQERYMETEKHQNARKKYIEAGRQREAQERYMKTVKHQETRKRYIQAGKHSFHQASYMETDKYQKAREKYIKTGKHRKAQAKYEDKFRFWCKVCEMKVVKPFHSYEKEWKIHQRKSECKCPPVDRRSYLQTKRYNKSKSRNRDRIRSGQDDGDRRLKSFRNLCLICLRSLKRGYLYSGFNKFHLVEGETVLEYSTAEGETVYDVEEEDFDEIHSWLSEVDGTLLCLIILFQKVVLVPKSRWLKAIKEVSTKEEMQHLSDELYRLIGKLQSFENHQNTEDISIPEEFKCSKAVNDANWFTPETLSNKDEKLLIDLLEKFVGEEYLSEDLQMLLRIEDDNVETALLYTKR